MISVRLCCLSEKVSLRKCDHKLLFPNRTQARMKETTHLHHFLLIYSIIAPLSNLMNLWSPCCDILMQLCKTLVINFIMQTGEWSFLLGKQNSEHSSSWEKSFSIETEESPCNHVESLKRANSNKTYIKNDRKNI